MSHLESEGAGGFPVELCRWTSSGSSRVRRGYRAVDEKRRTGDPICIRSMLIICQPGPSPV